MLNALLNLETYATTTDSAIAQISVVYFDVKTKQIFKTFLANINPESEMKNGYYIDLDTVEWWDKQPKEIKDKLFVSQISIKEALNKLYEFIETDTILWCNKQFDPYIFTNAFKVENIYCPIKYNNFKDIDTLCYLANIDSYKKIHDANIDISNQMGRIISAYTKIKEPI